MYYDDIDRVSDPPSRGSYLPVRRSLDGKKNGNLAMRAGTVVPKWVYYYKALYKFHSTGNSFFVYATYWMKKMLFLRFFLIYTHLIVNIYEHMFSQDIQHKYNMSFFKYLLFTFYLLLQLITTVKLYKLYI